MLSNKIKFISQHDQMDCGPACLAMICRYYKKNYSLKYLRNISYISREGVSLLSISEAAKKIGFKTLPSTLTTKQLIENKSVLPCILYWNQNHFVVLYGIKKSSFSKNFKFYIADPGHGKIKLNRDKFEQSWITKGDKGILLFFNPTKSFFNKPVNEEKKIKINYLFNYLTPYKKQLVIMFFLLLVGSMLTLIFPFLTQYLIDKGVKAKDVNFIFMVLFAELTLFLGTLAIRVFRNLILLYIGTHLSISIISEFFKNMLKLPVKFFDTKLMGDFQQRIQDNNRIEKFLSSQSLTTLFSIITFVVFFGVLCYYSYKILLVYLGLTTISILWSLYWMKKRRMLDYFRFQKESENQESVYEMLNGGIHPTNYRSDFSLKF